MNSQVVARAPRRQPRHRGRGASLERGWHAEPLDLIEGSEFVNSMALRDLIHAFDPPPPPEVVAAADRLTYRDFLIVTLVLDSRRSVPGQLDLHPFARR